MVLKANINQQNYERKSTLWKNVIKNPEKYYLKSVIDLNDLTVKTKGPGVKSFDFIVSNAVRRTEIAPNFQTLVSATKLSKI